MSINRPDNDLYPVEYGRREYRNGRNEQIRRVSSLSLHVQAFISNITAPGSIEELRWYIHEHGNFNV